MTLDQIGKRLLLDEAAGLVRATMLPRFGLRHLSEIAECELRSSRGSVNAFILPLGKSKYRISVLEPLLERIADAVQVMANSPAADRDFDYELLRKAGLGDENGIWVTMYLYAVTFVILHEFAHLAGGHIEYDSYVRGRIAKLGFSERRHLSGVIKMAPVAEAQLEAAGFDYAELSQFMELEADGVAADILFASITSVPISISIDGRILWSRLSQRQRIKVRQEFFRTAQTAMTLVIAILEETGRLRTRNTNYPFPRTRALNLLTRRLRHLKKNVPQSDRPDGYTHMTVEDPEEFVALAREAFWMTLEIDKAMKSAIFHKKLAASENEFTVSEFIRDVMIHLSGRETYSTEEGLEIKSIAAKAAGIYAVLGPYRKADLWSRH